MPNPEYQRLLRCSATEVRDRLPGNGSDAAAITELIGDLDEVMLTESIRNLGGHDLDERVRAGTIGADDLFGGTFTNTGSRGALFDTPIINQPQSAILGTGTVVELLTPVFDGSGNMTISVTPMVHLSPSYDHRIVDGADAARYLGEVKRLLERGYTANDLT